MTPGRSRLDLGLSAGVLRLPKFVAAFPELPTPPRLTLFLRSRVSSQRYVSRVRPEGLFRSPARTPRA